jgi:hypothetical protein
MSMGQEPKLIDVAHTAEATIALCGALMDHLSMNAAEQKQVLDRAIGYLGGKPKAVEALKAYFPKAFSAQ